MSNHHNPSVRVGIDIGGTFTDLMLTFAEGEIAIGKVLTTPTDPSQGVEEVLTQVLQRIGRRGDSIRQLIHGTTLVTNSLIERTGARTALITSQGFRDSIEIGREHRFELYDLMLEHPAPLVPRHLRFAVPERTLADGTHHQELDEDHLARLAGELAAAGVEAVAVCFLHSYTNPESENRARQVFEQAAPHIRVSLSSQVSPEIGEFARASTTIANVYVQPLVESYLTELQNRLRTLGMEGQLLVMLSSGGTATPQTCIQNPVRMLESGPAAGALAAAAIGKAGGRDILLSFDMGGTTAKLSVVEEGEPLITSDFEVDRRYRFKKGSGLPVKVPVIEMIEIGAGGGSIARVDALGLLKVGPDSAGADPGPVCYGRGGDQPTVTDADLVLGYLDPQFFLGGTMPLDEVAAQEALAILAEPVGLSVAEVAYGISRVVDENMANAARVHVIERGKTPHNLAVIAFGGAGPVHGYRVAELLGCPELILPYGAGVASALGLLTAPPSFDFVRPYYGKLADLDWEHVTSLFQEMETRGNVVLAESGVDPELVSHTRLADLRYVGQGHQIGVPVPSGPLTQDSYPAITQAYDGLYRQLYGRPGPPVELEALSWRVVSRGPSTALPTVEAPDRADGPGQAKKGERPAFFAPTPGAAARFVDTAVYDRYQLQPGTEITGPAIIEERESTTVIGPGGLVKVNERLDLVVKVGGGRELE